MAIDDSQRPKLRTVEAQLVERDGVRYFAITDPRRLAAESLMVREELGPYLAHADGTMTVEEIKTAARQRAGAGAAPSVTDEAVRELFERLDALFLLDGERYETEVARKLKEYRSADFRIPALEDKAYPSDPDDLLDLLEGFAPDVSETQERSGETLKSIITPHIDFARGGDTYAELWRYAAPEIDDVELAVVFGTDHQGAGPRMTLTGQSYATPWNILPTDTELVAKLANILKRDTDVSDHPYSDEFSHISEHSIELASIWLNWAAGDRALKMLPILCGSLSDYVLDDGSLREASPTDHPQIADAIGLLQQTARHRRTIFVAAADLSHVGPAFGDEENVDNETRKEVEEYDSTLMSAAIKGDYQGFLETIREDGDDSRICGLAPIYMSLWAAGASDGRWMGYQQCPADQNGNSFVSIAGGLLY